MTSTATTPRRNFNTVKLTAFRRGNSFNGSFSDFFAITLMHFKHTDDGGCKNQLSLAVTKP
jgi:hypothetical protein